MFRHPFREVERNADSGSRPGLEQKLITVAGQHRICTGFASRLRFLMKAVKPESLRSYGLIVMTKGVGVKQGPTIIRDHCDFCFDFAHLLFQCLCRDSGMGERSKKVFPKNLYC